jgi:hypothetical protein
MNVRLRRGFLVAAPVLCISLIGTSLLRSPARPAAATIDDLRISPDFYNGEVFSSEDPEIQGEGFGIRILSKNGTKFVGETPFSGLEGSVKSGGKFSAKTTENVVFSARTAERPRAFGPAPQDITFKGQLSADGSAIIGTYKIKGSNADRGTFVLLVSDNPKN